MLTDGQRQQTHRCIDRLMVADHGTSPVIFGAHGRRSEPIQEKGTLGSRMTLKTESSIYLVLISPFVGIQGDWIQRDCFLLANSSPDPRGPEFAHPIRFLYSRRLVLIGWDRSRMF